MTSIKTTDGRITPKPGCTPVEFRYAAPDSKSVFLAADFNGWSDYETPLEKGTDGFWKVAVALPPGRYEFKFVVDGNWYLEASKDAPFDGRDNCHANSFGTMNHVIDVGSEVATPEFQRGAIGTEISREPVV